LFGLGGWKVADRPLAVSLVPLQCSSRISALVLRCSAVGQAKPRAGPANFFPQWGDVPTWIAAVVAALAFVAAVLAYRKQSEAYGQQAEQVELQRRQLEDQRNINVKLAEVAELQVLEIQESLAERKREAEDRRRTQASKVFIWEVRAPAAAIVRPAAESARNAWLITAHASNTSDQPVYDLEFIWHAGTARSGQTDFVPQLLPGVEVEKERRAPQGATAGRFGAALKFRDASGKRWLRRPDGELTEQTG
jgi:hypothetical protein